MAVRALPQEAEIRQASERTRARVRRWVLDQVRDDAEVDLPELAREAVREFQRDKAFIDLFFEENFYALVYGVAASALGVTRGSSKNSKSMFARWLEHAGDRHVLVLQMTSGDLALAAQERRQRGRQELALADLWDFVGQKLQQDEKVGDHFTLDQLERLYHTFAKPEEE